jgi:hypothetical protein
MEQFIPELPMIQATEGAPWLWMVRRFQDDAVVILREIRGQRLQGGGTPRGKNIYPPPPATLASSLR